MTNEQLSSLCEIARQVANKRAYPGTLSSEDDLYSVALEGGLRSARSWKNNGIPFESWVGWGCKTSVFDYFRSLSKGRGHLRNFKRTIPTVWTDGYEGESPEHLTAPSTNGEYTNWIGFWDLIAEHTDAREFRILWSMYYMGYNHIEVGEQLNLTSSRISQIRIDCLKRLRPLLAEMAN